MWQYYGEVSIIGQSVRARIAAERGALKRVGTEIKVLGVGSGSRQGVEAEKMGAGPSPIIFSGGKAFP